MAEIKTLAKRATEVRDLVTRYIPEIRKAVPKGIDALRLARVALTLLPNNPKLLACDSKSLLGCILQASAWGLELDPVLGLAYLVPYGQKAQLIIGYQGLMELARRSGDVKRIYARVVFENDDFQYELGLEEKLVHVPAEDANRGNIRGVYGVAVLSDGERAFEYMSAADVEKIRSRSRAGNDGPWVTDKEMMYRKTVIRRLLKYQSRSVEVSRAVALDEKVDSQIDQDLHESFSIIDLEPESAETIDKPKSSLDKLADKLPAKHQGPPAPPGTQAAPDVDTTTGEIHDGAPDPNEGQAESGPEPEQQQAQAGEPEPGPQGDPSAEPAAREEAPEPATTKAEIAAVESQQKKADPAPRPVQPPPNKQRNVANLQERAQKLANRAPQQPARPAPAPRQTPPPLPTAAEIPFGDAPGPSREPGEEG